MDENSKRAQILFVKHQDWLEKVAYNITKDATESDDLISDLYLYLLEKPNPKIWYADSFNLQYCRAFLLTRWVNRIKIKNRSVNEFVEVVDSQPYDIEEDMRIQNTYDELLSELDKLKTSKNWASAKLAEMYWFSDDTLGDVADKIKLSRSTVFLNVKKIKQHVKTKIENPFNNEEI